MKIKKIVTIIIILIFFVTCSVTHIRIKDSEDILIEMKDKDVDLSLSPSVIELNINKDTIK